MGVGGYDFLRPRGRNSSCSTTSRYQTTPTIPAQAGFIGTAIKLDTEYEGGNLGHRIPDQGGLLSGPPQDSVQDMRSEMLGARAKMGVKVEKHHHEVASASTTRHEVRHADADGSDRCRSTILHPSGRATSTARPPPHAEAGLWRQRSGMHCPPVHLEGRQAVSPATNTPTSRRPALSYIAGVIKHAKAISAFTKPVDQLLQAVWFRVTKRRCCSPTPPATARRMPHSLHLQSETKRRRGRFPDPMANPYLGFAAMLMAGLDGVKTSSIRVGDGQDLTICQGRTQANPTVCGSLREALENLDK